MPAEIGEGEKLKTNAAFLAVLLLALAVMPSAADGPQFTAAAANVGADHLLTVTFTQTGLQGYAGQYIVYRATARALVHFHCVRPNGRVIGERTYAGSDWGIITPDVRPNDTVSYMIQLAQMPSDPFTCRGGRVVLAGATYTDVIVSDLSHGVQMAVPGLYE